MNLIDGLWGGAEEDGILREKRDHPKSQKTRGPRILGTSKGVFVGLFGYVLLGVFFLLLFFWKPKYLNP